ncbi:hypothetical protein HYX14_06520 [Candidatus Woesearchaeota archaeon]|nr:hypothetical protein [Candidatus Woesearchaeota archaeon]
MSTNSKVYEILTKKRYNRDEPHLKDKLKERFDYFILHKKPIKLIGFWGVGPKSKLNGADLASCEFLVKLNNEVKEVYPPGIEFTFIFATLHGIHNGIIRESIDSYTKEIETIFKKFDFKFIYLNSLWKKYEISFGKIDAIFERKEKNWRSKIENNKTIEKNAENRNQRLSPKIAAQKYYIMRDLEKEMLEKEFSNSIFHAFSDSKLRNVLPNLPTLYFYSRRGWSDTPWFVTEDR